MLSALVHISQAQFSPAQVEIDGRGDATVSTKSEAPSIRQPVTSPADRKEGPAHVRRTHAAFGRAIIARHQQLAGLAVF